MLHCFPSLLWNTPLKGLNKVRKGGELKGAYESVACADDVNV
jgi:hypothetical protein